jgi:cellulose synthase/poly-beta-1,6-N-acetylglucosamine synthase-like glycosyltransferase
VTTLIQIVAISSALVMVLFALSQAWLALNYKRSKHLAKNSAAQQNGWQGPLPRVLLQLPIFNEIYVVERLIDAVAKIDYPADLLTIQLLDDSTDETSQIAVAAIAELKNKGHRIHHVRREDRSGFKAGALQAGLALNNSEFVAIFDADFIPRPNFLKEILGYFNDPKIGMVQTRWEHLNAEYSLLTKLLSFGIDAHFSVEQGGRQATGSFINFNGTAGMWRRKAIDEAGGWHNDCLTEDLDLSFRTQLLGWRFLFVETITTPSELPIEMTAIRTQQFRWTKGAAETGKKNLALLWGSTFSLSTKIIGSFHMLNSFVFPNLLILSLSLATFPFIFGDRTAHEFLPINIFLLISASAILFTYWTAHTQGRLTLTTQSKGSILVRAALFMLMSSGLCIHNGLAVVQGLMGRKSAFMRTPKLNIVTRNDTNVRKRAYLSASSYSVLALESILAVLFSGLTIYCFSIGYYAVIPSYVFFAGGYLMVVYFTVVEILANLGASHEQRVAPILESGSVHAMDKTSDHSL